MWTGTQPLLFPEDLREWLPENHLVHFIAGAVERMDVGAFKVNETGSGSEQYPLAMMMLYCYATGCMSSRVIEEATYSDVAVRYICGNRASAGFGQRAGKGLRTYSRKCRGKAQEMGYLKKVGNISVDGTKTHANASWHSAVSYKRAVKMIAEAEKEVGELLAKAEEEDSRPLEAGLTVPEEIEWREDRKAAFEEAKRDMEKRYEEVKQEREEEARNRRGGEKKRGGGGKEKPLEKYRYNFTDPESRIMKVGNVTRFEQSYNAQAATSTETMLVAGG
jgi:transposase